MQIKRRTTKCQGESQSQSSRGLLSGTPHCHLRPRASPSASVQCVMYRRHITRHGCHKCQNHTGHANATSACCGRRFLGSLCPEDASAQRFWEKFKCRSEPGTGDLEEDLLPGTAVVALLRNRTSLLICGVTLLTLKCALWSVSFRGLLLTLNSDRVSLQQGPIWIGPLLSYVGNNF